MWRTFRIASRRMRGAGAFLTVAFAAVAASCGGSTALSSLVGPTSDARCETTISASPTTFSPDGGRANVTVSSARECTWSATTDAGWITITPSAGQGNGSIRVAVAANSARSARSGAVTVNGQRVQFAQEAAPPPPPPSRGTDDPPPPAPSPPPGAPPCTYQFAESTLSIPSAAGEHAIQLTTASGCAWDATASEDWLMVLTPRGAGGSSIRFRATANGGAARSATLSVAQASVTVRQGASTPSPAPPPPPPPPPPPAPKCTFELDRRSQSFGADGGEGDVSVFTSRGCTWSADSDESWVSFAGASSGSASGTVVYRVAPNSSSSQRSAILTIAGLRVAIDQRGAKRDEKPQKDDVDGRVSELSGSCPNLSMRVSGRAVETNRSTKFKHGNCSDIRQGTEVKVEGKRSGSGPIVADEVEIKSRH